MRITAKAAYACLAVVELASSGDLVTPRRVREIAEAQGIPERYLVQILLQLKAAGFVQSTRGSEGGYWLVRSPEELSVADVVGVIDGPPSPLPHRVASPAAVCLFDLLKRARTAEQDVLASATIAQLVQPDSVRDWVL
jgi:Rrf2 family protein